MLSTKGEGVGEKNMARAYNTDVQKLSQDKDFHNFLQDLSKISTVLLLL